MDPIGGGFFASLFQQFSRALLWVFCVRAVKRPEYSRRPICGRDPERRLFKSREYITADTSAAIRQQPYARGWFKPRNRRLPRRSGHRAGASQERRHSHRIGIRSAWALRRALDGGGVEALPAGLAQYGAIRGVQNLEENTVSLIDAMEALALANLRLLPGARPADEAAKLAAIGQRTNSEQWAERSSRRLLSSCERFKADRRLFLR